MALFGITRYDGDSAEPSPSSPSDILATLHQQAKERKQQKQVGATSSAESRKTPGKRKQHTDEEETPTLKKKKKDTPLKEKEKKDLPTTHKKKKHVKEKVQPLKLKRERKSKHRISESSDSSDEQQTPQSKKKARSPTGAKSKTKEKAVSQSAGESSENDDSRGSDLDAVEVNKNGGDNEVGGFTIIGEVKKDKVRVVHRVLPDWLARPSVISADIRNSKIGLDEDTCGLEQDLVDTLQEEGITHLFPVQAQVIPALLASCSTGLWSGQAGYRPSDVCCSAPTGSGKTLAFVLPIVQALRVRRVCAVRALVVLPVADLAIQVHQVFRTYCRGTQLGVRLLIGQKAFLTEQQAVVRRGARGYESLVDIIVATPGRLVDHINQTPGFSLRHLRFLVVDEADRMMEEIKQDWLGQVERAVYATRGGEPKPLTVASAAKMEMPLQKLLFSATLSQNPEKLQQLKLFQPKLFTSIVKSKPRLPDDPASITDAADPLRWQEDQAESGDFVGKYTTPSGLSEYYIECEVAEKALVILYLLQHRKFKRILCFTNSVDATHRLYWLVKLIGGCAVHEFSSNLHVQKRKRMLKQFANGKIDLLICSDAMARGMDVENVQYVISYEKPPYVKTYIHRVGRTARAGRVGTAVTLLEKKEIYHFKKMCRLAGKDGVREMSVKKADMRPFVAEFQDALKRLPDVLKHRNNRRT